MSLLFVFDQMGSGSTWLDRAKKEYGGTYDFDEVEGVKYVVRLVPYLILTVPYWTVYSQMSTAFQNQVRGGHEQY